MTKSRPNCGTVSEDGQVTQMTGGGKSAKRAAVFVGASTRGLSRHVAAARKAITDMGLSALTAEADGARAGSVLDECRRAVGTCYVYVGIVGTSYGDRVPGSQRSLLHISYEAAEELGLPALVYLVDEEKHRVRPEDVDAGDDAERLARLRRDMSCAHTVGHFATPAELAKRISEDLPPVLASLGVDVGPLATPTAKGPDEPHDRGCSRQGRHLRRVLAPGLLVGLAAGAAALALSGLTAIGVEKRLGADQVVTDKPPTSAILTRETAIWNANGDEVGRLFKNTLVYADRTPKTRDGRSLVRAYSWTWHEGVVDNGALLVAVADAKLRYRANTTRIGWLKKGTVARREYCSDKGTWYLCSLWGWVASDAVTTIAADEPGGVTRFLTKPRAVVTVTSRAGGVPQTFEVLESLVLVIALAVAVATVSIRLGAAAAETRKDVFTEVLKAILAVLAGVAIAFVLQGLGPR